MAQAGESLCTLLTSPVTRAALSFFEASVRVGLMLWISLSLTLSHSLLTHSLCL